MKKNIGSTDKLLRLTAALVLFLLYFFGVVEGTIGIVLLVFGVVLVVTALISFCPLYPVLGMNTCCRNKACDCEGKNKK